MALFVVDVEADGPAPGLFSMVSFGVVKVDKTGPGVSFYGKVAPISDDFIPDALAVSGFSREEHLQFEKSEIVMPRFLEWLAEANGTGRPSFVSDNPAFDWQFMNYYLWRFTKGNPFGHSARRIGDFYAGLQRDFYARQDWKNLRQTKHTHNPVDDAKGNVEALVQLFAQTKRGVKG
jgi:hypothetical protein